MTMQQKRQALADWLDDNLNNHGNFTVVQELKRETFDSIDRATRVSIMGDPTAYCEVLHRESETIATQRTAGNTRIRGRYHRFHVRIWFSWPNQDTFDTLVEQTVLDGLEQLPRFEESLVMFPEAVSIREIALDGAAEELAHFCEFDIEIR